MADGTCDLDDPGKPCERAGNGEGQEDQLFGIEAAETRGAWCCADHADFKTLDHSAEQDRGRSDDEHGEDRAEMQTAAVDQKRHRGDWIELRGGWKVEAVRIAPRTAHEIIEEEVGD